MADESHVLETEQVVIKDEIIDSVDLSHVKTEPEDILEYETIQPYESYDPVAVVTTICKPEKEADVQCTDDVTKENEGKEGMVRRLSQKAKYAILMKMQERKNILFGEMSDTVAPSKTQIANEWKKIHKYACSIGVGKQERNWQYIRDVFWPNCLKCVLAKIAGNEEGKSESLQDMDYLILDILGKGKRSSHEIQRTINRLNENRGTDNSSSDVDTSVPSTTTHKQKHPMKRRKKVKQKICIKVKNVGEPPKKQKISVKRKLAKPALEENVIIRRNQQESDAKRSSTSLKRKRADPVLLHEMIEETEIGVIEEAEIKEDNFDEEIMMLQTERLELMKEKLKIETYNLTLHCLVLERELGLPPSKYTKPLIQIENSSDESGSDE